ncbi:MAG: glycerophosphodiester phosphodiesterase [Chlorobium sp.]|nr:MAG: glycerophosphodiester phosphodiesterase [Chlorobium sp.]
MAFEIQAHRGARALFPENTIPAFCCAASLGARVVELDLMVSKDHQIVVSHDPWLPAPPRSEEQREPLKGDCGRSMLYAMPYADIALFDCARPHPSFPQQARMVTCKPLLSTVFREVDAFMADAGLGGSMLYNLEIKSWPDKDGLLHPPPAQYAELVVQLVEVAALSDRVRIQSFDERVVREAWKLNPELCYGLLIDYDHGHGNHHAGAAGAVRRLLSRAGFLPAYLNPHHSLVDRELTDLLHERGIRMIPWTVNDPGEMLAMHHIGADGIITDYPDRAIALFSRNASSFSGESGDH